MKRLSLSLLLLCLGASNAMAFPSLSEVWNDVKSAWNSPWTQGAIKGSAVGAVLTLGYVGLVKDTGRKNKALLIYTGLATLAGIGIGSLIQSKQVISGSVAVGLIFGRMTYNYTPDAYLEMDLIYK